MPYEHKKLIRKFKELYEKDEYSVQIADIISGEHGKKSIIIDHKELSEFDPEVVETLVENPELVIRAAEEALEELIKEKMGGDEGVVPKGLHARFWNFGERWRTSIRYLRSADVGRFVVIEGLVKKASEVRPKLIEAAYMCRECKVVSMYEQEGARLMEPLFCKNPDCGLSKSETGFKLIMSKSVFVDEERLEIQELPEKLEGGQQPQRIIALAEDDMAGILAPGDRVIVYGVLQAVPRTRGNIKSTTFDFIFRVNYVDKENKEYTDIEPSEEDIKKIEEIAHSGDAIGQVVRSIAPTVYGHDDVKKALALQLFGGVAKEMPDGTHIRGDIHILLVGDPGTAKSQMLRYMSSLSPRGVYASGRSASAAGLTAAAVKDEGGDGRWTLEAGALVMADGGIACVDEMDKMSKEDRSSMHEAMEQQTITVVKAGISATLKSRCALLGAANPKYGRFSGRADTQFEEIDLPAPLISRFDMIFIMLDEQNPKRDKDIAHHILKGHRIGEKLKSGIEEDEEIKSHTSLLEPELLKKYVSYAKRKNPIMTDGAIERIESYYLEKRKAGKKEGTVAITARHLEALIRMTESSARIRLSEYADESDAEVAIELMKSYLENVLHDDVDTQYTGESRDTRNKKKIVQEALDELFKEHGEVRMEQIKERLEGKLAGTDVEEIVKKMWKGGEISEKRHGVYVKV